MAAAPVRTSTPDNLERHGMKRIPILAVIATIAPIILSACMPDTPAGPADPAVQAPVPAALKNGRKYTFDFYDGKIDSLEKHFSAAMQAEMDAASLAEFHAEFQAEYGREYILLFEDVDSVTQAFDAYFRAVRFSGSEDSLLVEVDLAGGDTIVGMSFTALKIPEPSPGYQAKSVLRLPFAGEWTVFWGGRYAYQNYHNVSPNQYYAYDLLIKRNRTSHTGDGRENGQYYCFNAPVLSPGSGRVMEVENGVADNVPGVANPAQLTGNHVIIDHGGNEYSLLAHFKQGSITVRPGDSVATGQEIGRCGNSGNSSEPHIHYQLQESGALLEGRGLPARFRDYIANGREVKQGEPVRGQRIENAIVAQ